MPISEDILCEFRHFLRNDLIEAIEQNKPLDYTDKLNSICTVLTRMYGLSADNADLMAEQIALLSAIDNFLQTLVSGQTVNGDTLSAIQVLIGQHKDDSNAQLSTLNASILDLSADTLVTNDLLADLSTKIDDTNTALEAQLNRPDLVMPQCYQWQDGSITQFVTAYVVTNADMTFNRWEVLSGTPPSDLSNPDALQAIHGPTAQDIEICTYQVTISGGAETVSRITFDVEPIFGGFNSGPFAARDISTGSSPTQIADVMREIFGYDNVRINQNITSVLTYEIKTQHKLTSFSFDRIDQQFAGGGITEVSCELKPVVLTASVGNNGYVAPNKECVEKTYTYTYTLGNDFMEDHEDGAVRFSFTDGGYKTITVPGALSARNILEALNRQGLVTSVAHNDPQSTVTMVFSRQVNSATVLDVDRTPIGGFGGALTEGQRMVECAPIMQRVNGSVVVENMTMSLLQDSFTIDDANPSFDLPSYVKVYTVKIKSGEITRTLEGIKPDGPFSTQTVFDETDTVGHGEGHVVIRNSLIRFEQVSAGAKAIIDYFI